jgi:hypothetical protein
LGLRVSARSHEGFERAEKAFQIEADDAIALDVRAVRHGLARTLIEAVRAGRRVVSLASDASSRGTG